jgi:predicted phage terminase large subunit-like protein
MFKRDWLLPTVAAAPAGCPSVRYWDKAGTTGSGDHTAGVRMVRSPEGLYYVTDVVRGQWSAGEREKVIRHTAEQDGRNVSVWVEQEPGSGGKESAANTVLNLAGWNVHAEPVTGDKETRARPLAAQAEAGNVRIVADDEAHRWVKALVDEMVAFPFGKHDDQVDAAAGAFNKLALVARPRPVAVFAPTRTAVPSPGRRW